MTLASYIRLILLAMIWGASFLFQRISVPELGPNWVAVGRLTLGALTLVLIMLVLRKPFLLKQNAKQFFWIGLINSAVPFWLFAYASITLPAGVSAVLNAMVPLFSVLLLWLRGDWPSMAKIFGVLLGIIGVAMIVGFGGIPLNVKTMLGFLAGMSAAALYAYSATQIKKHFSNVDSMAVATGSLLGASVALLPTLFIGEMPSAATWEPWLMLIPLGVLCSGIAYLLYFRLISDVGSTRATMVTLIVPVFALAWGALFLKEHPTLMSLFGTVLVLFSISLILEKITFPKLLRPNS
jgi:drug/metabolite transporter (DMT)-like permease